MPSQRFYYRPPDPGFAALGAGIGRGIESGVTGYLDEKDRRRSIVRQEEEDQRRRDREDYERSRQELFDEIALAEAGGGMGPPPTDDRYGLDFGGMGMARGRPSNALTDPVQLGPEPQAPGIVERAAQDPDFGRYRRVGAGEHAGYIEDPEWRAENMAKEQVAAETAASQQRVGRIAMALTGFMPNLSEQEALSVATLLDQDIADYDDLFPEEEKPSRWYPTTQKEAEAWYKFQEENKGYAPRTGGGGGARATPTYGQAYDFLSQEYYDPDQGMLLSPAELHEFATAMSSGQDVDLPPLPGATMVEGEGVEQEEEGGGFFDWAIGEAKEALMTGTENAPWFLTGGYNPFRRSGGEEEGQTRQESEPEDVPHLRDVDIPGIRQQLDRFDQSQWRMILEDVGYSREEIDRILGR